VNNTFFNVHHRTITLVSRTKITFKVVEAPKLVSTVLSIAYQHPGLKVIKLRLQTSLKSQASDWLKWRLVAISANQMLEI
jgi:hypothetical protein